jgi:hypothetical protein
MPFLLEGGMETDQSEARSYDPQKIVFRNKEIGDKLCGKNRKKVVLLSKYSLDRNNTIASLFRAHTAQYTPDF